jgi:hypothetical protein
MVYMVLKGCDTVQSGRKVSMIQRPVPPSSDSTSLKMETAHFSKMLVAIYRITKV